MVKKLIAYGDSFVMGGGILPNNTTYPDSWPQLLGKKLGIEAINRGVGGGSNKRSINNLLEDIEIIKQENHIRCQREGENIGLRHIVVVDKVCLSIGRKNVLQRAIYGRNRACPDKLIIPQAQ